MHDNELRILYYQLALHSGRIVFSTTRHRRTAINPQLVGALTPFNISCRVECQPCTRQSISTLKRSLEQRLLVISLSPNAHQLATAPISFELFSALHKCDAAS